VFLFQILPTNFETNQTITTNQTKLPRKDINEKNWKDNLNEWVTCEKIPVSLFFMDKIFPKPLSRIFGNERSRRVCPVGAVSKTIESKESDCTNL
jgi:hypothetical protein